MLRNTIANQIPIKLWVSMYTVKLTFYHLQKGLNLITLQSGPRFNIMMSNKKSCVFFFQYVIFEPRIWPLVGLWNGFVSVHPSVRRSV